MEYIAIYEIDCGVSRGFGLKEPDTDLRREKLNADSPEKAFSLAVDKAIYFARDYLSNPNTGMTTVKIVCFHDSLSNPLSQKPLNKNPGLQFDEGRAIVKSSTLEHLLIFIREQSKNK